MRQGYLSEYFEGVAIKRLKAVETNPNASHQHEFNGIAQFKQILGTEKQTIKARFFRFGEDDEVEQVTSSVTWYDARANHPTRSEYRLYFKSNAVMNLAAEGDLLIVAKRPGDEIYLIVVQAGVTFENQLLWLFQTTETIISEQGFQVRNLTENDQKIGFAARFILEELMLEVEEAEGEILDQVLSPYFETGFPTTAVFSALARQTVHDVSAYEDPDHALLSWMDYEERMFKRLERHLVSKRLEQGFVSEGGVDVEGFIKFSLSVHNTRKSRVGHALENHLEEIFKAQGLFYSRNKVTENRSKPDFLFPSVEHYHDAEFSVERLTMLGVKSTCKDRWRQVLAEANKIRDKHLLTLEPGISVSQTEEMRNSHLQLVLPKSLHSTYTAQQQPWLMNLEEFLRIVRDRQSTIA